MKVVIQIITLTETALPMVVAKKIALENLAQEEAVALVVPVEGDRALVPAVVVAPTVLLQLEVQAVPLKKIDLKPALVAAPQLVN